MLCQAHVTIQAQDKFNHVIPQSMVVNVAEIGLQSDGVTPINPAAITPTSVTLDNTGNFVGPIALLGAGTGVKIKASAQANPNIVGFSNAFNVVASLAGYTKLLLLLPGERIDPGIGKQGAPTFQQAGNVFNVIAFACDPYFNPVDGPQDHIQFASNKYAFFTSPISQLQTDSNGVKEAGTPMILRTANTGNVFNAIHTITAVDIDNNGISSSTSVVQAVPGAYSKVQILAPGEAPDPGTFDPRGKTNALPTTQQVSVPFNVTIRAVDNYWNLVNYSGGDVTLQSPTTPSVLFRPPNSSQTGILQPFLSGTQTRVAIFGKQGAPQTLTALDSALLTRPSQSVDINVIPGPQYVIQVPTQAVAGQNFPITVLLVDTNSVPLQGYNETVFVQAVFPTGAPSRGDFNKSNTGYTMNNGSVTFTVSYPYVETIQALITDNFARAAYSSNINVVPSGLEYLVTTPAQATVGLPNTFPVTVQLRDSTTHTAVLTYDHPLAITVLSAAGNPNPGQFSVSNANLTSGLVTFQESYTKAEGVVVQVAMSTAATIPFTPSTVLSNNVQMLPDGYKKLLLIAPGETWLPGVPSTTGKTGLPLKRQVGVPFLIQVRGVDEYWNEQTTFSGGTILYSSNDNPPSLNPSNPSNQNGPLVNGELASFLTLFQPGNTTVTVKDTSNGAIGSNSVILPVGGLFYLIQGPLPTDLVFSGPPSTFNLNITLMDSGTGLPVTTIPQKTVTIQAIRVSDGQQAAGNLQVTSGNLVNGALTVSNEAYSIAETILIRVSDKDGITGTTTPINLQPRQIRYQFVVPPSATVKTTFPVEVDAYDFDTNTRVSNLNRTDQLQAFRVGNLPPSGILVPTSITLFQGVGLVNATYDHSEDIFLVLTDTTPAGQPAFPVQAITPSPTISIKPGPLAAVDMADFAMKSNTTQVVTLTARDALGDPNPNQTLIMSMTQMPSPSMHMKMNGQMDGLTAKTDSQGQLQITFAPSMNANGLMVMMIRDGDNLSNAFRKFVNITAQGLPSVPLKAAATGANRFPVNGTYFIDNGDLKNAVAKGGGTLRTYYSLDNGPYVLYNDVSGISAFPQTRDYALSYYSVACYDPNCVSPVSELDLNGGPHILDLVTYVMDSHVTGYPSPFNPKGAADNNFMTIQYPLATAASVDVDIYNLFMQKVWHTNIPEGAQGAQARPDNRVFWYGMNEDGVVVGNGGYIVIVKPSGQGKMQTKVMVAK